MPTKQQEMDAVVIQAGGALAAGDAAAAVASHEHAAEADAPMP